MTIVLFFLSFAFYLCGLNGTVPAYRDSGDLIASIYTLGIAHPPGYAFYVLLGKLFVTLLPFGNIAYRVNVMSVFFAAATIPILFKLLYRVFCPEQKTHHVAAFAQGKRHDWAGLLGALVIAELYATSPSAIALSRVAEMYTLSACLAAAILYSLFSDMSNGMSWAALLLGLGLSVHPTLIFLAPLFVSEYRRKYSLTPLLYFLLGLSVFLYLPIRASQHPLLNWGDPSSWRNFWRVVTRADYGGLKLHPEESVFAWTPESIWAQLIYFVRGLKGEWGWAGAGLGLVGIIVGIHDPKRSRRTCFLLISWILAGPGFFLLSNLPLNESTTSAILQPYFLLANLLWAPFIMNGFLAVAQWKVPLVLAPVLIAALVATRPLIWTSQRNDFYAYDYARNLLRSLPSGAVLYDPDDTTHFSIQVLQTTENRRPDVVLLNFFRTRWGYEQIKRQWPDLLPPIPIENGQELQRLLWSYSARQRPFFADVPQKLGSMPYRSQGLVYALESNAPEPSRQQSTDQSEALLKLYVQRGDFVTLHHPDFFTRHIVANYAAAHCNLGLEFANANQWGRAVEQYQSALAIDPDLAAAYNDWGIVAYSQADYRQAAQLFQKGLTIEPGNEMLQKNAQLALQKMRKLL